MNSSPDALPATIPLDMDGAALRQLVDEVLQRLVPFVDSLKDQPAHRTEEAASRAALARREPIPEVGTSLGEALDHVFDDVVPWSFNTAGPGYLAYVPGGGLISAAVAEMVAAVVNRYVGVNAAAPVAAAVEGSVIRWLAELMGMPAGSGGVLTTGGSLSNFIAVVAAREKHLGQDIGRGTAYASTEVHHCMTKALRLAGIPSDHIRSVPVDGRFRMRLDALAEMVATDRSRGLVPFFVCGSAGTVNTGAVDPLGDIANLCSQEGLWFHVDGAYGAAFRIVPSLAPAFEGMERADSIALDPHKGFFLAYGTGALLVRHPADLRAAHAADAAYLPVLEADAETLDFCSISPELSRDWRGLRLWLPFRIHGVRAFRDALQLKRDLAVHAADTLEHEDDVELAHWPALSLFAFRQRHPASSREDENAANRDLLARINAHRRIMITGTEVDGTWWLRICVLHLRTDRPRIDEGLAIIQRELAASRSLAK